MVVLERDFEDAAGLGEREAISGVRSSKSGPDLVPGHQNCMKSVGGRTPVVTRWSFLDGSTEPKVRFCPHGKSSFWWETSLGWGSLEKLHPQKPTRESNHGISYGGTNRQLAYSLKLRKNRIVQRAPLEMKPAGSVNPGAGRHGGQGYCRRIEQIEITENHADRPISS